MSSSRKRVRNKRKNIFDILMNLMNGKSRWLCLGLGFLIFLGLTLLVVYPWYPFLDDVGRTALKVDDLKVDNFGRNGLDCRPECYPDNFYSGLFDRTFSKSCYRPENAENTAIWLHDESRYRDGCLYEKFANYDAALDELNIECPIGSEISVWKITPSEHRLVECDDSNTCFPVEFILKTEPKTKLVSNQKIVKVGVENWGPMMVQCSDNNGFSVVNIVPSPKILEKDLETLRRRRKSQRFTETPVDVILYIADSNYRFGFMEGIRKTRKVLNKIEYADPSSGARVFEFMQHSCFHFGTARNVPHLMTGCPRYGRTGEYRFWDPEPEWKEEDVYVSLTSRYMDIGYYVLGHFAFGDIVKRCDASEWVRGRHVSGDYHTKIGKSDLGIGSKFKGQPNGEKGLEHFLSKKNNDRGVEFCKKSGENPLCKCVAGMTPTDYFTAGTLNYIKRRDAIDPSIPIFAVIHEGSNHGNKHGTGPPIIDIALERLLSEIDVRKTVVVVLGDHGAKRLSSKKGKFPLIEDSYYNPPLFMVIPESVLLLNEGIFKMENNIRHNQVTQFTTHYDIYRTLRELPGFYYQNDGSSTCSIIDKSFCDKQLWHPDCLPPGSFNLLTDRIPENRSCLGSNLWSRDCLCRVDVVRDTDELENRVIMENAVSYVHNRIDTSQCWSITSDQFEIVKSKISELSGTFETEIISTPNIHPKNFVTKERLGWVISGNVENVLIKDGKGEKMNFVIEAMSRTTSYDAELCKVPEKKKDLCICKEGNNLG